MRRGCVSSKKGGYMEEEKWEKPGIRNYYICMKNKGKQNNSLLGRTTQWRNTSLLPSGDNSRSNLAYADSGPQTMPTGQHSRRYRLQKLLSSDTHLGSMG